MKILFLCTHNRCRSILAEAVFSDVFKRASITGVCVHSAGSQAEGIVHPLSLKALARQNIPYEHLLSQSWDDFQEKNISLAITVCDSAAQESCPNWMLSCPKIHWGLQDPSKLIADEKTQMAAFDALIKKIQSAANEVLQVLEEDPDLYKQRPQTLLSKIKLTLGQI